MSFKVLEKRSRQASSAVDYPAIIIKTGRTNSMLNGAFMRELGLHPKDKINLDILFDEEAKKFAIHIYDDGQWHKKVSKSNMVQLWMNAFLVNNEIYLKGHAKGKAAETIICALEYDEDEELWMFEIPEEYFLDGPEEAAVLEKPEKKKKKKKKKKKRHTEEKE